MDIALCISQIAKYSGSQINAQENIALLEKDLESVTMATADPDRKDKIAQVTKELTKWKTLLGFYNEFITFWKDQIQQFKALLKSIGELAQPAR